MAAILVAHLEVLADLTRELLAARLLRIEMVEARLACLQFPVLGDLETLGV